MTTTRPLPTLRFLPHPLAAALHLALLAILTQSPTLAQHNPE